MKNKELFSKTVSILVKAYQNDTLIHSSCHACAVGNIIAGNMEIPFSNSRQSRPEWIFPHRPEWQAVHSFYNGIQTFDNYGFGNWQTGLQQIESTGYTPKDTAKIEHAFETVDYTTSKDERMFAGLMAVVDTLMQIHEATETEAQQAKELFVKV